MITVTEPYDRDHLLAEEMDLLFQRGLYEMVEDAELECAVCQPSPLGLAFYHFGDGPWTKWKQ